MRNWTVEVEIREELENWNRLYSPNNDCVLESIEDGIIMRSSKFVPVRAIPYITGGCIPAHRVPQLLSLRDEHYRAHSYRYIDGAAERVNETEWWGASNVASFEALPAGLVVNLAELNAVMRKCFEEFMTPYGVIDESMYCLPEYNEIISSEIFSNIMEGITIPKSRTDVAKRANSASATRNKIMKAAEHIREICKGSGLQLEFARMRGTKKQFLDLLRLVDSTIAMTPSTFNDYVKRDDVSLMWRSGDKTKDGEAMVICIKKHLANFENTQ